MKIIIFTLIVIGSIYGQEYGDSHYELFFRTLNSSGQTNSFYVQSQTEYRWGIEVRFIKASQAHYQIVSKVILTENRDDNA
jgi:hypothetical protein